MVGLGRFELPTSRLSSARSNQLSYKPDNGAVALWATEAPLNKACIHVKEEKRRRRCPALSFKEQEDSASHSDPSRVSIVGTEARLITKLILRKEVIQPQVPLRLPCYDFTPVADPTVVACLLAVSTAPSGKTNSHGVTGGVYKARERIHRAMLMRDY